MHDAYSPRGELGEAAENLLARASFNPRGRREAPGHGLSPDVIHTKFSELVKLSGASNKLPLVVDLIRTLNPVEAKYVIKIITGDLRIGLKENTVEEAISKA